ncbi:MAG: DUF4351 domain-containing protein [Acidobacteriota bacterium]
MELSYFEEVAWKTQGRMVCNLLEHRFGTLTPTARKKVEAKSPTEIDELAIRLLDATSLHDLDLD